MFLALEFQVLNYLFVSMNSNLIQSYMFYWNIPEYSMMTSLSNELDVITSGQILSIVGSKYSSPSYSTKYSHADISHVSVSAKQPSYIPRKINAKLTGISWASYISWISIHARSCSSGNSLATRDGTWMPAFPWSPVFAFSSSAITFSGFGSSTNTVKFTNTTIVAFTCLRKVYLRLYYTSQRIHNTENNPCLILDSDATGN